MCATMQLGSLALGLGKQLCMARIAVEESHDGVQGACLSLAYIEAASLLLQSRSKHLLRRVPVRASVAAPLVTVTSQAAHADQCRVNQQDRVPSAMSSITKPQYGNVAYSYCL